MAEYTNVATQTVATGSNVLFAETPIGCPYGAIVHREGSGTFRLKGLANKCQTLYKVWFGGNVAIPTGGTVAPISIAITVDGEPLGASTAIVTPAAVGDLTNLSMAATILVPRGCCVTVSVENNGTDAIEVANANLMVSLG